MKILGAGDIHGDIGTAVKLAKKAEDYKVAIVKYNEILEMYDTYSKYNYDTNAVYKRINECQKLDSISKIFNKNIAITDSLREELNVENLLKTDNLFIVLNEINYEPGNKKLSAKINANKIIKTNYIAEINRIVNLYNKAGMYSEANKLLKQKLELEGKNQ